MSPLFAIKFRTGIEELDMFLPTGLWMDICFWVSVFLGLAVYLCFLLSLSKALRRCRATLRTMNPDSLVLNLIPFFGVYWQFVTVNRIAESLKGEFQVREQPRRGDYGKRIGLTMSLLFFVLYPLSFFQNIFPATFLILQTTCELIDRILLVVYWVIIAGYSRQLAALKKLNAGDVNRYDGSEARTWEHR